MLPLIRSSVLQSPAETIILIENGMGEKEAISNLLRNSDNYKLIAAPAEQAVAIITELPHTNLIIYDLASFQNSQLFNLSSLMTRFPYIPCITIIDEERDQSERVYTSGVSQCLVRPLDADTLCQHIEEQLELATSGQVRRIPIHSLLQMFESDEQTCTLRIQDKNRGGLIFVEKGVVVGAETDEQEDEDAIYSIIAWEEVSVEIRYYNSSRPQTIRKPLMSLIMEGFRLKDERASLAEKEASQKKIKLELQHISTAGNRISIDIGSKIKIELDEAGTQLITTMVGMIQDEYLIVSTSSPVSIMQTALNSATRLTIKYLHMGRICMFRTLLLKIVEGQHHLLFLEYPPVIHYHQLRRTKRTSIFIPCTLHLPRGPEFSGVLVDLSIFGCLCQIKIKGNAPLPSIDIDTKVNCRCLLPGLKEAEELRGRVKNIKKSSSEIRIGLEFTEMQDYLMEIIERYVSSVNSLIN